jgi:FAD/FMN-containing dehydrogenase
MPRRESPTGPRRLAAAERTRQAMALKKAGKTYEEIRRALGISKGAAVKAVQRGLAEIKDETSRDAEEHRAIESARLDTAQAAIWPQVMQGDLAAIDRFVRLSQRRAALLGLDAPTKVDATVEDKTPPRARLDALLDGLAAKIAARETAPKTEPPTPTE